MADLLFTEAQWRDIVWVEKISAITGHAAAYYEMKRVYGASFSCGEFYVAETEVTLPKGVFGPPKRHFYLLELPSRLIFSYEDSRVEAIADGRECLQSIGAEFVAKMIEEGTEENRATEAAREAREAIAKAKTEKKPRKIGRRARAVFEKSEGKCHYCQTVLTLDGKWHIEHKFPRALFGGSEQDNLVAACAPCNHKKRDKTDLEFQALMAERNAA
jgi:5-methylcytosine-specific restriction endonuclease McrA